MVMKRSAVVFTVFAVMATACSELQSLSSVKPKTVDVEQCSVNTLMAELRDTRSMNKVQLQNTLQAWERDFQADPSDNHRLRLALLYAVGDESIRDRGRAQDLLVGAADALNNPGDRELAAMMRQLLEELTDANQKVNSLNKQVADQNKRISELVQKQRALMNIEQKIQQRDTPAVIEDDK